jgi:hypothetical protein
MAGYGCAWAAFHWLSIRWADETSGFPGGVGVDAEWLKSCDAEFGEGFAGGLGGSLACGWGAGHVLFLGREGG